MQFGSVETTLPTDFSLIENDSMVCPLSLLPYAVLGRNPCILLTTGQNRPTVVSEFLYVFQSNSLHYRILLLNFIVTVDVKLRNDVG